MRCLVHSCCRPSLPPNPTPHRDHPPPSQPRCLPPPPHAPLPHVGRSSRSKTRRKRRPACRRARPAAPPPRRPSGPRAGSLPSPACGPPPCVPPPLTSRCRDYSPRRSAAMQCRGRRPSGSGRLRGCAPRTKRCSSQRVQRRLGLGRQGRQGWQRAELGPPRPPPPRTVTGRSRLEGGLERGP